MTRKTVIVLGAGGFIGRRVVAALTETAWARPIAAGRRIVQSTFPAQVGKLALDATDLTSLARALERADGVVNCIAGNAADILRSGRNLLECCADLRAPPRVVHLGSMAAYGAARGVVDEESPLLGDIDAYSAAKAAIDNAAAPHRFVVRLRPGIVYGPESPWWSDRIARLLVLRRIGDLGACGMGFCNLVHVDDVATAVVRSLEVKQAGGEAINLGSPEPPSWNAYFRAYAHALGAEPIKQITSAALRAELLLYGPILRLAEIIMRRSNPWRSRPPLRPWLLRLCRHDMRMATAKAESMLAMRWLPLETGLSQTAAWFLAGNRTP